MPSSSFYTRNPSPKESTDLETLLAQAKALIDPTIILQIQQAATDAAASAQAAADSLAQIANGGGSGGTALTSTALASLLVELIQLLPTAPTSTPSLWNDGGIPVYS